MVCPILCYSAHDAEAGRMSGRWTVARRWLGRLSGRYYDTLAACHRSEAFCRLVFTRQPVPDER